MWPIETTYLVSQSSLFGPLWNSVKWPHKCTYERLINCLWDARQKKMYLRIPSNCKLVRAFARFASIPPDFFLLILHDLRLYTHNTQFHLLFCWCCIIDKWALSYSAPIAKHNQLFASIIRSQIRKKKKIEPAWTMIFFLLLSWTSELSSNSHWIKDYKYTICYTNMWRRLYYYCAHVKKKWAI